MRDGGSWVSATFDLIIVGPCAAGIVERVLRHGVSRSVSRKAHRDVTIVHPG